MLFGLRTDIDKIINVLILLSVGMDVNATSRAQDVTPDSISNWLVLAANHVNEFSAYMQHDMHLTQVQTDKF